MRKLKLIVASLALLVGGANFASAKTDVTSTYLTNAGLTSLDGWTILDCGMTHGGYTDWQTNGDVPVIEFYHAWNPTPGGAIGSTKTFNFSQKVNLPVGYYRLAVNAFYREGGGNGTNTKAYIYAGENYKQYVVGLSSAGVGSYTGSSDLYKAANAFSRGDFSNEFDFQVTEAGTIEIGFHGYIDTYCSWCILGPVKLYEYTAADYIEDYRAKVTEAEALFDKEMFPDDMVALIDAVVDESTLTTVDKVLEATTNLGNKIIAANNSIIAYPAAKAKVDASKAQAQAIADVEYTEVTAGSHDTFIDAISAVGTIANSAAVETIINDLKIAVREYIAAAEPKNDGEYFDITILMANPDFDDNNINGWTKVSSLNPNTRIQCNEFYGKASFDFYQMVEGLANGSYTLSMRAFQRPGDYNTVYADWANGINKATAKVYVNNDESDVKNIMAEMNDEIIYNVGAEAFNTDKMPNGASGYIPNSMEGAAAWFAAGHYQSTVAALVEDGSLTLGFKDQAHESDCWTLFDEFRLRYYGSSKMIYYKQQLPAIKAAANEDFSNALYANVTGKEKSDFEAAIAATPASETEAAYKEVIDNITAKQTAFREAASAYDAFVELKAELNETVAAKLGVDMPADITSASVASELLLPVQNFYIAEFNAAKANYPINMTGTFGPWDNVPGTRDDQSWTGTTGEYYDEYNIDDRAMTKTVTLPAGDYVIIAKGRASGNGRLTLTDGTKTITFAHKGASGRGIDTDGNATFDEAATYAYENKGLGWEYRVLTFTSDGTTPINLTFNWITSSENWASLDDIELYAKNASVATKSITAAGWATYCSPYALDFTESIDNLKGAYFVTGAEGDYLTLELVSGTVPAGTGLLLESTTEGTEVTVNIPVAASSLTNVSANKLVGVTANTTIDPYEGYVLMAEPKVAFYWNENAFTVGANTAYLPVDFTANPSAPAAFQFITEVTGISEVNAEVASGEIYNLAGQRVSKAVKGLYIQNGKKILVK